MKTNRGEFWLGYNFTDWRIEYNYIYKHSDQIRFDNKKWDYEHNLKARWKYSKALAPYIEVGNISVHKTVMNGKRVCAPAFSTVSKTLLSITPCCTTIKGRIRDIADCQRRTTDALSGNIP